MKHIIPLVLALVFFANNSSAQVADINARQSLNNSVRTSCKVYNIWSDGRGTTGSKMYVSVTNECNALGIAEVTPVNCSFAVTELFPNPATSELNIGITCEKENEFHFAIYDISGRLTHTDNRIASCGKTITKLDISNLSTGNYVLKILSKDGYQFSRLV